MSTSRKARRITASVALADGRTFTADVPVRYWKSRLMEHCPYGVCFCGAKWSRS